MQESQLRLKRWLTSEIRKRIKKTKKIILAMPAAATAIPENPSSAAKSATIKNPNAQRNITTSLCFQFSFSRDRNHAYFRGPVFWTSHDSVPL